MKYYGTDFKNSIEDRAVSTIPKSGYWHDIGVEAATKTDVTVWWTELDQYVAQKSSL